ncbi:MAG TPA: M14 family metallopeptidase [Vicinamibacteria bacterium]|nr:M14 family metallopeptidase [Vicinamibacteria bacterium]
MKYRAIIPLFSFVAAGALAQEPRSLDEIFSPGFVLEDRDGDGLIDFVNAELGLGPSPSAVVIAAASDIATRLGFETMAMNLPLTESRTGVLIAIGAEAPEGTEPLASGEGLVTISVSTGRPTIFVTGADDEGLRAAASYLAGRAPHLWDPNGPTFETLHDDLAALVGNEPRSSRVVEVRATRDGLSRLTVALELASTDELTSTRRALQAGLGYEGVARLSARLVAGGRSVDVEVPRKPVEPKPRPIPPRPGAGAKHEIDLSNLFTPDGLLGDSDQNLIADRIDAVLSPAESYTGAVDLVARLGLEAAGFSIPIAKLPEEIEEAEEEPTLILVGNHPQAPESRADLTAGEGYIGIVSGAFGEKPAVVVTGGDDSGVERALEQMAVRFPNVWERGKDRTTLDDVEMEIWKFFSGRSPAGQAAIALYKLDRLVDALSAKDVRAAKVLVSLEKPDPAFERFVAERAQAIAPGSVEVVIDDRDVTRARTVFEENFVVPSEVNDFWRLFRERVLPKVSRRRPVEIEARLSEPRAIRRQIEERAREELEQKGVRDPVVRVLSAYKQGYSFLEEIVGPRLAGQPVDRIEIRFARYVAPSEWPQQAMQTPLRWLHEAFPVDEVLARDLGVPIERIRYQMAPADAPAYGVVATSADGTEIVRETFSPKIVLRPYLDRFRDYEMVNVTTGWISARSGNEVILDQRIATDAEKFWDHYQGETLERIYDYVMQLHEGNPRGGGKDAPYFGELEVRLELSEPHEVLGIDQEIISPMDALHEDVYFTTLMFFRILGRNARGEELTYAGRVIPRMIPKDDGRDGTASIRFSGFATSRPAVVVEYEQADGTKETARLDIPKIEIERPRAMGALVRAGRRGLERLEVRVKVNTDDDERDELIRRERSEDVDESILSAEQVVATIDHLNDLREGGAYRDALAYHDLGEVAVIGSWEYKSSSETERTVVLRGNGVPSPFPDVSRYLVEAGSEGQLVQWDTPIPPPEAYGILARMAKFEEATVYKVGESYLGREVWAMDLMPPIEASHFSTYKATTLKPTVVYSARQHANEVSSTSHVLKLAEELLTDPDERKKLDRVNVVIHPVTNPDGAQLAYDLYRETPEFILHAGYLASLGMDATSDSRDPMPLYPESSVRPRLWNAWLPDIFLNPHGYPSHQLVQLFSEFTGLVRGGRVTERNWSMNKGWFMPGFDYIDDPRYPRHKEAAFAIRDYITAAINTNADVHSMNQRNYQRYDRYGGQFDDDVFKLPMVNEVMIHTSLKGERAPSPGSDRGFNPKVTIWSGTTEAPDETAEGDWLKLVASAGLHWDRAILQYLLDGNHKVERKGTSFFGGVSFSLDRPRPPKPEENPAK